MRCIDNLFHQLDPRRKNLPAGGSGPGDMSYFDAALQAGSVARFDMIIPNDCENCHDRCGTTDSVRQFDDFVHARFPSSNPPPRSAPMD